MPEPTPPVIRKGDILELFIDSLAYGGRGVARMGKLVVFVKKAIPGQTVNALVYRKKSGYAEARALEVIDESPHIVDPPCKHFPTCGGCAIQQLDYTQQVEQKRQQVEATFRRQAGLLDFEVDLVVPADRIFNYRNKMEFTISNRRWLEAGEPEPVNPDLALGLHIPGRYDKILDICECHIQPAIGNAIINLVRDRAVKLKLKPYDPKSHVGFLRHLALRFTDNADTVMVNIVTSWENPQALEPLVVALKDQFPQIISIVNNINTRKGDTAYGEKELLLFGNPTIVEHLSDLTFEISANSFFQTNSQQAEKLYAAALEGAALTGDEVVYDLFCGTGSIALFVARHAKKVYGFELVQSAVEDATRNALTNRITNAHFFAANLEHYFTRNDILKKIPVPDVVVLDPPRAGIHERLTRQLPVLGARRIVYVSCNPTTQARDIQLILASGYKFEKLTMVDMFPHTPHIETVAVLSAGNN